MPEVPHEIKSLHGARFLPLPPGSKDPYKTKVRPDYPNAHLSARTWPIELKDDENYGLALDREFLVVDVDREGEPEEPEFRSLPETFKVKSRKGYHYYYRVPLGYLGGNKKFSRGDVKCKGYMVGAGSVVEGVTYQLIDSREPAPAPTWLLDLCLTANSSASLTEGEGIERINDGEGRRSALVGLAGYYRGRLGLSTKAIFERLWEFNNQVLVPPKSRAEVAKIANSADKWGMAEVLTLGSDGYFKYASDCTFIHEPISWWVHGWIPKGYLVMLFGKGGIGKSSWGSWLASEVTKRGGKAGIITVEENFELFLWRASASGGLLDRMAGYTRPIQLQVPKDIDHIKNLIELHKLDLLYFDSIYSHFETYEKANQAEKARKCLSPLAQVAQETKCTILGVFHKNKADQFLGSTEMVNVARVVLEARREGDKPFQIAMHKTNLLEPKDIMQFEGIPTVVTHPVTGEVQQEYDAEENLRPQEVIVHRRIEDASKSGWQDMVSVDELGEAPEDRDQRILDCKIEHPDWSVRKIADELKLGKTLVANVIKEAKNTIEIGD